ncbi:MAG: phytanoyl-CoA dioxygenase family protein [Candidatus Latescibacterota bacterium]|nr:phytanoyl-CoA dioxygenase family protein [Candidatus Latescibacterota bacterium]
MELRRVSDEQRTFFEDNGYLIVRKALSPNMVTRVTTAADVLMDSFEFEGYYQHRRDGIISDLVLTELATQHPTISLVIQLLGTHIHITNTALIYKHPQPADDLGNCTWHRDVGVHLDIGHGELPRVGLKMGYCLTDMAGPSTGATIFAPGSNLLTEPLVIPKGQIHPEGYLEPELKAGDAFLFESRIYHGAAINTGKQVTKIAMFGYHYSWVRPDYYLNYYDGEPQPNTQVLESLDDIGRQLLRAPVDSKGREAPNGIDWPIAEWAEEEGLGLGRSPQWIGAE